MPIRNGRAQPGFASSMSALARVHEALADRCTSSVNGGTVEGVDGALDAQSCGGGLNQRYREISRGHGAY